MKKLLIVSNIITLVVLYFTACTTSRNSMLAQDGKTLMSDYSNSTFIGLKGNLIKDITKNYKSNFYPSMRPSVTKPNDSRSVWFNLDTLKKFLWNIETLSKKNGLTNLEGLGIRIYFARYPQENAFDNYGISLNGVRRDYANMHTLFMIPTYFNSTNNYNVEFDPNFIDPTNHQPKSIFTLLKDDQQNRINFTVLSPFPSPYVNRSSSSTSGGNTTTQNHGDLIPPMNGIGYDGADLMEFADLP